MGDGPIIAVNHIGYVVSDLDLAGRFFEEALGFERVVERTGKLGDPEGDLMLRRFGVNPRATGAFIFFRLSGFSVELLGWESPDRNEKPPKNSDAGGRHLALSVTDMKAATERIAAFGGAEIREPNDAGFIYVKTPFGLEIQLIPV
jgi:catechol 2,3-dioxygenase-like lactoylglutathione lyase family enzyme